MAENITSCIAAVLDYSQKIVKLCANTKKTNKSKITIGFLDARLEMLNGYWLNYTKQCEELCTKYSKDIAGSGFKYDESYETTEESFLELKTWIKNYLHAYRKQDEKEGLTSSAGALSATTTTEPNKRRPKLPPIPIPTFSGDYNEWMTFNDLFTTLVHNDTSLSKIEKHYYLRSSLSGEAEQILMGIPMTEANYTDAWKKLKERYDDARVVVNHILSRLLNQKKLTMESPKLVKELLDTTNQCLTALKNLKIDISSWDAIIVHIVVTKLDLESIKLWEQSLGSSTNIPTFAELSAFLENRFRSMEMVATTHGKETYHKAKEFAKKDFKKSTQSQPSSQPNKIIKTFATEVETTCTYCSQNHYICHCKDFALLDVSDRQYFIKKNNICFNCLVKGHTVNYCRQSTACRKCGRRHHTLLHYVPGQKSEKHEETSEETKACNLNISLKAATEAHDPSEEVILATAQIDVKAKNDEMYKLRALIDQGSQASFVTESAAQLLNLDRVSVVGKISGISQAMVTIKSMATLTIYPKHSSPFEIHVYILKKLTSLLPSRELPQDTWPSSMQLDLADPYFHKPGSIDVLLGADVHAHIILEGIHKHNSLIALNSQFGWLISGKTNLPTDALTRNLIVAHTMVDVDQSVRRFWEMEENIPDKRPMNDLEIQCEDHYKTTHTRNTDGSYVVRLPFREDPPTNLGDSRPLAVKRLHQMERRFINKPEFRTEYDKFLDEYESLGHMELAPEREKDETQKYYLPHHAVLRPSSLSTKLRVVFDGSAAPENGKSLNDELLIGYPLQQDIRELITRWRQHKIGLVADIQKMYRQIFVSNEDVKYQKILWRKSSAEPISEYNLLTVTYGTSCAPFLAIRTLHQLADDEREEFPEEADILKTDFYMDDLMTGASTEEKAITLQKRLTELLARGGFPLHKWACNSEEVLQQIPDDDKDTQGAVHIKIEDTVKTLGITWNSQTDNFGLNMNFKSIDECLTKRHVLSSIAKTFDPLGWLAPAIIVLKIFMQKLWLAGLDWDEELTDDLKLEWNSYQNDFAHAEGIQLPRWLGISDTTRKIELHGFSDASCAAYAAVVYLRVLDEGEIKVRLVMAKSKVAPVKQVSLPRLELCGALLLAQMLKNLKAFLNIDNQSVFAWTDSTIVLAWLRKPPITWTTFVANRTSEILTITHSSQWSHINSANNPADPASRGLSLADLRKSKLWWEGPNFLKEFDNTKPKHTIVPETDVELKRKQQLIVNLNIDDKTDVSLLDRFSNLTKLIRVTAYCLRFVQKCKSHKTDCNLSSHLTTVELKNALNVCIRLAQQTSFQNEIYMLTQGKTIPKNSKLYTLQPYLDNDRILRVGGRLLHAKVSNYTKSPIILDYGCPLSKLLVSDAHWKTLHGGYQLTLNYVRQKFWIVRVKNLVRHLIRKCIPCFKQRATPLTPFMANLPEFRVNPGRPFRTSGVDFAGPFTLKAYPGRCKKTTKAYICLFVCTVTKAIHLELVSDLTSSAFLASFKRFTSRRGHCKDLWSDCGTNFVGAARELDLAFKNANSQVAKEIAELLSNDQTNWHFIPPGAPHFGGLWESGVKSVKGHIKRVVGETNLTFEEFATLLTQIEACVNSRPLTLIDPTSDELPLTPGHFLIGEAPITVPEESLIETKVSWLDRWHLIQRMVQCLWQRWQAEYLTTLQNRYKWCAKQPDIKLGTIVLVKDDRLPPGKWLLGRVIAKHPGSDGITRVVSLQYKNSTFKRPVTKLCPLPLDVVD